MQINLTEYAHGGGCGCKIAPQVLEQIIQSDASLSDTRILVGNGSNDDAAVYDMGNGECIISTTDFFTPIVNDPFDFGCIAAANSISDIYAMGGKPIMAIAILGWPVEKLPAEAAKLVLDGARTVCKEAGIIIAGGHSIDAPEPFFGLAVNGTVSKANLKQNNKAKQGDLIFITKPLGIGLFTTAMKRKLLKDEDYSLLLKTIKQLNKVGESLGKIVGVNAMTDITGFGLLGHLIEMSEGSVLSAELRYKDVPMLGPAREYLAQKTIPDATYRNWNSYSSKVRFEPGVNVMEAFNMLPDPQTNGGIMVAVDPSAVDDVINAFKQNNIEFTSPIGKFVAREEKTIIVQ